jgi:tetratricopeptide (TPR) repeat protein
MFKPDFARENYGCRCGKILQLFFWGKHLNLRETRNAVLHPRVKRFKEHTLRGGSLMKTIFRFLGLAVLAAVFTVAGGVSIFAQVTPAATPTPAAPGPCDIIEAREALETKVRTNFDNKDYKIRQLAVDAGEEYIKTYGSCEAQPIKDFIVYLNGYLPPTKTWIAAEDKRIKLAALYARFDPAVKSANWDEVYASGKQILALEPDGLNQILVMGSIGLDETLKNPRVLKYNDDTLKYAKMGIQKLEAGKTTKFFGFDKFAYGSKDNALGWMNYTIGAITYFGQNNKKDALPYLYKAVQVNSDTKKLPQVYGIIGDYYFEEVKRLGEEIRVKTVAAGNKDTDETKALIAQLKGYAERAIDAYARAQNLVDIVKNPKAKPYKDSLGSQVETLYQLRFQKLDGLKDFVSVQVAKPIPDPTSVPAPIVEVDPADVPPAPGTTAPGTNPGTKPVTPAPAPGTAKPAVTPSTNGTKPPATAPTTTKKPVSVNGTGNSSTTAAAKPTTKKPVVKKKGTR